MPNRTNVLVSNFVGGELSGKLAGRPDIPVYKKGMAKVENFILWPQGGASFRTGTTQVKSTRLNRKARWIPFQYNDAQSYLIEATDRYFRFYKDNGIITQTGKAITGITTASPGVITAVAHGYAIGDEVYISGVVSSTGAMAKALNGKFFLVDTVPSVDTFTLREIPAADSVVVTPINTTGLGVYTSGGSAARVYEIATPYVEKDLFKLQHTQNADTMYIACYRYEPLKLNRGGHASWTLASYPRVADPFSPTPVAITGMTIADPAEFTVGGVHGLNIGDEIYIPTTGTGTPEVKGKFYTVKTVPTTSTFTLYDDDGVQFSSIGLTYSAGNDAVNTSKYPAAVCFLDTARLAFGGTRSKPEGLWTSKAPDTAGTIAFDDFTTGTNATDGMAFVIATLFGKVDAIQWMAYTNKFLVIGTYGGVRRAYGATESEPISPTAITVKPVTSYGCEFTPPISNGNSMYYVQRGGRILRSLEYDFASDGYNATDRNLVSEHLTVDGIKQIVDQQGQPDIAWALLKTGRISALTYKEKEDISGWFRVYLAGQHVDDDGITQNFGRCLALQRMPRPSKDDQMWFVVERVINGGTYRTVEYTSDKPKYPVRQEYFTGLDNEDADIERFDNALYEAQKDATHLDMSLSYDGTSTGSAALANVTPGATTGTGVTFTASAAVFTSDMVNREIRKPYNKNGIGGGRAKIKTFTDSTHVICDIVSDFDNVAVMPYGKWLLTTNSITGLESMEGQTVGVIVDGGTHVDRVVAGGSITLTEQASKAVIGLKYTGTLVSMNVDTGGITGTAQAKVRSIIKSAIRFFNSVGCLFGSDLYKMERIAFRKEIHTGRPSSPVTGILEQGYEDAHEADNKIWCIQQDLALPCDILGVDLFVETSDE